MPLHRLVLLLPVAALSVACFDDKDDDDEDDEDDEDSGYAWGTTGTTGTPSSTVPTGTGTGSGEELDRFAVDWLGTGIDIEVGPEGRWIVGIAETAGCSECWTGEDCVYGYDAGGTTLAWCHETDSDGTTFLTYGGDPGNLLAGTTVFPDSTFEDHVTWFLESPTGSACYVFGDDPGYYDGLGCSEM